jgi:hypothetical protein
MVVPLISNMISNDLIFGNHTDLAELYAQHIEYPLSSRSNLSQLIQFKSVVEDITEPWDLGLHYLDFVKNRLFDLAESDRIDQGLLAEVEEEFDDLNFTELCERLEYPKSCDGFDNPLLILANFPLPIYLTTSYHSFIESALRKVGKTPHTEFCRWHDGLKPGSSIPSLIKDDYEPNQYEPLVYHLHGYEKYPNSLVLREDDHFEFLVASSEHKGKDADVIDGRIRLAIVQSALVLLGYSLRSWDFRSLFWGLIKPRTMTPRSVSVQLNRESQEQQYLEQYLSKAKFDVFWGTPHQYVQQLHREWEGSA